MKPVYAEFGADLDVATIYADALMVQVCTILFL
jgi:hypothetical protein